MNRCEIVHDAWSDVDLVRAWRTGDKDAGDALLRRHLGWMRNFFRHRPSHEADDLVQQTFLTCALNIERFNLHASFRGFLAGIARNQLRGHFRQHQRYQARLRRIAITGRIANSVAVPLGHPWDIRLAVSEALESMAPMYRTPLCLFYWSGYSVRELSEALALSEGAVKTRLRRSRAMVARSLYLERRSRTGA